MNGFIDAMATRFIEGLKNGRVFDDWKLIAWTPENESLYYSKAFGHLAQAMRFKEGRLKHLVSVACDVSIIWYHERKVSLCEKTPKKES